MPITPATQRRNFIRPAQQTRATANDFGAAEAQGIANLGQTFQGVGQGFFKLQERQDKFVSQDAYNKAAGKARELYGETSSLQGKNAIGATGKMEAALDTEVENITQNMSGRQRRMFERNWANRREGFLLSATQHEANQVRAAELSEKDTIVKDAQVDYAATGDQQAYKAGLGALHDAMASRGLSPEEQKIRVEQYENAMNASRFDHLVKAGEFEEARGVIENFVGENKTLAEQALEGAEYNAVKTAESRAQTRLNEADARIIETSIQEAPDNPFYVPTLERFNELYSDPSIALAKFNARTAKMSKLRQDSLDAALKQQANLPDTRKSNNAAALNTFYNASSGAASPEQIQDAIDSLSLDDGEEAKVIKKLLTGSLEQQMRATSDAIELAKLNITAGEVERFNTRNDKNKWGLGRREIKGTVEVSEKGKLTSVNEATAYFTQYMDGFDTYLKQRASETGRGLTLTEVHAAGDEYFGAMREWETRQDIDENLSELLKVPGEERQQQNLAEDFKKQQLEFINAMQEIQNASQTNAVQ